MNKSQFFLEIRFPNKQMSQQDGNSTQFTAGWEFDIIQYLF